MALRSFRELEVWQLAMELTAKVYRLTMSLPHPHRYELGRQMRAAAVSVPSNIAEGYTQRSRKVYVRHLNIAAGSIAELDTQLGIAESLSIGDAAHVTRAAATCDRVGRMLNVLISRLSPAAPGS
jgi:four helix bundle protein